MTTPLIIKNQIPIQAFPSVVWKVLTQPEFIRQWDELPEGHDDQSFLETGSQILWSQPNGKVTKLTVTQAEINHLLKINLYNSYWPLRESEYNIAYLYTLESLDQGTRLIIEIGDFSALPEGQNYFDASLEFAELASSKIKILAESMQSRLDF